MRGKILAVAVVGMGTLACMGGDKEPVRWEYKVTSVMSEGHDRMGDKAGTFASVTPSETDLNLLGMDNWELVSTYLEMETAFPNFGNDDYLAGIQSNVRPQRVVFIFKRPLQLGGSD